jgi:hypothetical protein
VVRDDNARQLKFKAEIDRVRGLTADCTISGFFERAEPPTS